MRHSLSFSSSNKLPGFTVTFVNYTAVQIFLCSEPPSEVVQRELLRSPTDKKRRIHSVAINTESKLNLTVRRLQHDPVSQDHDNAILEVVDGDAKGALRRLRDGNGVVIMHPEAVGSVPGADVVHFAAVLVDTVLMREQR